MVGRLSCRRRAVVTAGAGTRGLRMVEMDRRPDGGDVAVLAEIGRGDMVGRLAGGGSSVVTAGAGASDIGMIEANNLPATNDVAIRAVSRCLNVTRRLALRAPACVARGATSQGLRVIEPFDGRKGNRYVAVGADICGCYVVGRLAGRP